MERALPRIFLGLIASVVLVAVFSASAPPAEAVPEGWWGENFQYQAPITLGARPDNYQIRIEFSDPGSNVEFDNFQDIRFTENAGNDDSEAHPLDYWIENYDTAGDNCIVWVRMPDNIDSEIFIYYGWSVAPDNSDVVGVWGFDAGFDSSDGWTEVDGSGSYDITNSRVEITNLAGQDNDFIYATEPAEIEWTQDFVWHMTSGGGSAHFVIGASDSVTSPTALGWSGTSGAEHAGYASLYSSGSVVHVWANDGGAYDLAAVSPNSIAADTTYYGTIQKFDNDGDWVVYTRFFTNIARQGTTVAAGRVVEGFNTSVKVTADAMGRIYAVSDHGVVAGQSLSGWVDAVTFRKYVDTEPTVSFGAENSQAEITVDTPTVNNALIDRDQDNAVTTPLLTTQVTVQVTQGTTGENADSLTSNVYISIRDASNNVVVDNVAATENTLIDENTIEFKFAAYNPADATADGDLGNFEVYIIASDNAGVSHTWGYTDLFEVSDLVDNVPTQENFAGHRHRIQDNAGRPDHGAITLTNAWVVDSNDGTFACTVSGTGYENIYTPTDNGQVYAVFETAELDGVSDTLTYFYPNLALGMSTFTSSRALIDNHASDNAITDTLLTVIWEDNDGFGDFIESFFYMSVRDAADVLIDNVAPDSISYENENRAILTWTFDAEDNTTLSVAGMGAWDVASGARDNWETNSGWWASALFTVDELIVPIGFTPTDPYAGWDLTVAGTTHRVSGTGAAVDNHRVVDALHGTFWQIAGNAYSENHDIPNASPGIPFSVTVTAWNLVLDGENTQSVTPHENQQYEISIRFEENFELVPWIPDAGRPITIGFVEGVAPIVLSSNPENLIISTGENLAENIFVSDNDTYIRRRVLDTVGGRITLIIVGDNSGTVGGTATGDVDDFTFVLQDLTGVYSTPNGIMSFRLWIGENLAIINEDFWGADSRMSVWLITQTRYQVWMRAANAPLRLIGPIDAVNSAIEKVILVEPIVSEIIEIYDDVYWAAYRVSDNVLRIEYQDNLDETTFAYVAINNYRGTLLQAYQPDNSWFIITYSLASPDAGYSIDIQFTHETYGQIAISVPISTATSEVGGITNVFNLPEGVTLASLGVFVATMVIALAFDSTRVPFGMLAMAMFPIVFWSLGWIPLPGPFNGAFTATMFLVAAVLVILAWRRR